MVVAVTGIGSFGLILSRQEYEQTLYCAFPRDHDGPCVSEFEAKHW